MKIEHIVVCQVWGEKCSGCGDVHEMVGFSIHRNFKQLDEFLSSPEARSGHIVPMGDSYCCEVPDEAVCHELERVPDGIMFSDQILPPQIPAGRG